MQLELRTKDGRDAYLIPVSGPLSDETLRLIVEAAALASGRERDYWETRYVDDAPRE